MSGCVVCNKPLEVEVERDEDDEYEGGASSSGKGPAAAAETYPDDVQLICGCHFHWDCLLSAAESKRTSTSYLSSPKNRTSKHTPKIEKARAFLEFCREGDYKAVIDMLLDDDMEEDEEGDVEMGTTDHPEKEVGIDRLLRYQDPIGDMQSGLHAAVFQEAEAMGIMRGLTEDKVDIRSLRDANGKTAEDIAKEVGGVWVGWTGNNRLAI
ncbi:hypothetical protein A1F94_001733 [Pyrenophora tritici-repentis]|nr:hypothetical protein A1F94_001733 [Pyrenophora tritici-repentis]